MFWVKLDTYKRLCSFLPSSIKRLPVTPNSPIICFCLVVTMTQASIILSLVSSVWRHYIIIWLPQKCFKTQIMWGVLSHCLVESSKSFCQVSTIISFPCSQNQRVKHLTQGNMTSRRQSLATYND